MNKMDAVGFSQRLNYALDRDNVPKRGRAKYIQDRLPYSISDMGIRRWLDGTACATIEKLNDLAIISNTTVDFLLGDNEYAQYDADKKNSNNKISHKVPILLPEQVADWLDADSRLLLELKHWEFIGHKKLSSDAFLVPMQGSSMTNPIGFPSLPNGSLLLVDPAESIKNGDIVCALERVRERFNILTKLYEAEGTTKNLIPLNPKFQVTELNDNFSLVGKVISAIQNFS